MSKIGRFEIQSEISASAMGAVYKATDVESGQIVALKTLKLELLGDQAPLLVKQILEEAECSKALNSHNIALLYGAGELEGQFCASMEYVQGNSIATTLARKEGFSIWDMLDVARQVCQGLDHARGHKVVHYTLEPAKIMVQWDGVVKILSYGVSAMGALSAQASGKAPDTLHYMSPEQLRGDPVDARSNLFSLGAILYEMATEKKAFDGEDADQVRQAILEGTPAPPRHINPKANSVLSEVILKSLSKAPEDRYASAQEFIAELEKCKDDPAKAVAAAAAVAANVVKAAPQPASVSVAQKIEQKIEPKQSPQVSKPAETVAAKPVPRAAAAAVGDGGPASSISTPKPSVRPAIESGRREPIAKMSTATVEPEVKAPQIKVDPLMDESRKGSGEPKQSFSEISELPPLKEVYIAPPPAPSQPAADPLPMDEARAAVFRSAAPEKPKVQPKEVAKKAVAEITKTPPKLFGYAIAAAIAVILLVVAGIAYHVHSENSDVDGEAQSTTRSSSASSNSNQVQVAQAPTSTQTAADAQAAAPITSDDPSAVAVQPKYKSANSKKRSKAAQTPLPVAVIPGQLTVNTNPQGAQVSVDSQNDPGWVTPYNMAGIAPGHHTVVISKAGYATETRNVDVTSGSKFFLVVQLAQLTATLSLTSNPVGAAVWMDGKDTGKVTPVQLSIDKPGNHSFVFKKQGYLDQTASANLQPGQAVHLSPELKALGTTDDIKIGGKFKKLFGGSDVSGMGTVMVKTQPKGAQIAVNNRMLDKGSPVEFYLNPGTYVVDITLSGYKSVQKIINVDKGGKVPVEETLEREP